MRSVRRADLDTPAASSTAAAPTRQVRRAGAAALANAARAPALRRPRCRQPPSQPWSCAAPGTAAKPARPSAIDAGPAPSTLAPNSSASRYSVRLEAAGPVFGEAGHRTRDLDQREDQRASLRVEDVVVVLDHLRRHLEDPHQLERVGVASRSDHVVGVRHRFVVHADALPDREVDGDGRGDADERQRSAQAVPVPAGVAEVGLLATHGFGGGRREVGREESVVVAVGLATRGEQSLCQAPHFPRVGVRAGSHGHQYRGRPVPGGARDPPISASP